MKRFLFTWLIATVVISCVRCATIQTPYGTRRFIMPQVGVVVRVINNCAPLLDIEDVGGVLMAGLPFGESTTVPLVSSPFSGSNRDMPLIVKGYTASREYFGSATQTFHVSTYDGTRKEVWEVNSLRLPNGQGGCR